MLVSFVVWNLTKYDYAVFLSKISPKQDFNVNRAYFALHSGPRAQPVAQKVSMYFFTKFHETTYGFKFLAKNFREYHEKGPNNT